MEKIKNYINNNIHTFNLLLMVSHFCDFGARLWKYFAVLKVWYSVVCLVAFSWCQVHFFFVGKGCVCVCILLQLFSKFRIIFHKHQQLDFLFLAVEILNTTNIQFCFFFFLMCWSNQFS